MSHAILYFPTNSARKTPGVIAPFDNEEQAKRWGNTHLGQACWVVKILLNPNTTEYINMDMQPDPDPGDPIDDLEVLCPADRDLHGLL